MADDNLFDVVEELRTIVADFKRALYGDTATRSPGLLSQLEGHEQRLQSMEQKLDRIEQRRRANPVAWTAGYVSFCVAVVFSIAALLNQLQGHHLLGIPPEVATWLAVLFATSALILFIVGFGWFER